MKSLKQKLNLDINENSIIQMRKHRVRWENFHYLLYCTDTEFCLNITRKWKMFIELLDGRRTLKEAEKLLLQKKHYFQKKEDFDFNARLTLYELIKYGFVEKIDGIKINSNRKLQNKNNIFPWLSEKHVKPLFSKPVTIISIILVAFGLIMMVIKPEYRPQTEHFFWSPNYAFSIISSFILGWVFLALHELGHLAAAKYYGLRASFSLGLRLYFLVAQTSIYSIFLVDKTKRMVIYSIGMIVDAVVISLCLLLMHLSDAGFLELFPWFYKILQQIILLQWLGIIWQFFFFMQTDVYWIVSDFLGCDTLLDSTKIYLRNKALFFAKQISIMPKRIKKWIHHYTKNSFQYSNVMEKEIVPIYSLFVIIGVSLMWLRFVKYFLPITFKSFSAGFIILLSGITKSDFFHISEGLTVLAIETFQTGAILYLYLNKSKTYHN